MRTIHTTQPDGTITIERLHLCDWCDETATEHARYEFTDKAHAQTEYACPTHAGHYRPFADGRGAIATGDTAWVSLSKPVFKTAR